MKPVEWEVEKCSLCLMIFPSIVPEAFKKIKKYQNPAQQIETI